MMDGHRWAITDAAAFLAGFFSEERHVLRRKIDQSRISVPSRDLFFLEKHTLQKSYPSRISVPSRSFFPREKYPDN